MRSLIQPAVDFMCSLFVSLSRFSQTVIGCTLDGTLFALFRFHVNVDADSGAGAHAAALKICIILHRTIGDALADTVIPP